MILRLLQDNIIFLSPIKDKGVSEMPTAFREGLLHLEVINQHKGCVPDNSLESLNTVNENKREEEYSIVKELSVKDIR